MAENMITKYDKFWDVIHGLLGIWNILDPRFKKMMVYFLFPKIHREESVYRAKRIFNLLIKVLKEYESQHVKVKI